ncbi:MAG: fumarate hydratase C-terminal domain-containing protein [Desulfobacterales bacterium]|nr:fumarate hydratase C-terminal domain-containing protein [Desulfobacterales bacterium]
MTEYRIQTPVSEEDARKLNVGDIVKIDGIVHVWRDRAYDHALMLLKQGEKLPENLQGCAHWHCGPITRKVGENWVVISAGPTTSRRFDKLEPMAIREWGVKLIIGKGLGMGKEVSEALKGCGAVYLAAVGGAASYYGRKIKKVRNVHWLELGMPEALWVFEVEDFGPLEVTMDSYGRNLYNDIRKQVDKNLLKTYRTLDNNVDATEIPFK